MKRCCLSILLLAAMLLGGCRGEGRRMVLPCTDTLYSPSHAKGFVIMKFDSSSVIRTSIRWSKRESMQSDLFVSRHGQMPPEGFDGVVIKAPVQRVIALSSSHVAMIDTLGYIESIKGVSTPDYVSNQYVRDAYETGRVRDVGYDGNINYEVVASLHPDLVLIYGITSRESAMTGKFDELGIPYYYIADFAEHLPLGKSEWLVAIGEMFDCRQKAEEIFAGISQRYDSLRCLTSSVVSRPQVMLNSPYRDTWFVPARNSYMAHLIEDAGGHYMFDTVADAAISHPVSSESAFLALSDADFWLNPNHIRSLGQLQSENPKFASVNAVTERHVYNCTKRHTQQGGSDFWESGAVRADKVLEDMIRIFHPELLPEGDMYYFECLE